MRFTFISLRGFRIARRIGDTRRGLYQIAGSLRIARRFDANTLLVFKLMNGLPCSAVICRHYQRQRVTPFLSVVEHCQDAPAGQRHTGDRRVRIRQRDSGRRAPVLSRIFGRSCDYPLRARAGIAHQCQRLLRIFYQHHRLQCSLAKAQTLLVHDFTAAAYAQQLAEFADKFVIHRQPHRSIAI